MKRQKVVALLMAGCLMGGQTVWSQENPNEEKIEEQSTLDCNEISTLEEDNTGKCGTNLTWTLSNEGTLTISGTGQMNSWSGNWHQNHAPWYEKKDNIKRIIIEEGVTSIGGDAFANCDSVIEAVLPDSLTVISDHAFNKCMKLNSIRIPGSVEKIEERTFEGCSNLENVQIEEGVKKIEGYAFAKCSSLKIINIPDTVKSIGGNAFFNCSNLISATIGSELNSLGDYAFYGCSKLKEFEVTDNNEYFSSKDGVLFNKSKTILKLYPFGKEGDYIVPEGVTRIERNAFYECDKITGITFPSSVRQIGGYAFSNCYGLTEINISNVEKIEEYGFAGCKNVKSVNLGTELESIGQYGFFECSSMESITFGNAIKYINKRGFAACWALSDVFYGGSEEEWNSINIIDGNGLLTKANIHFFAENGKRTFTLKRDNYNFINSASDFFNEEEYSAWKAEKTGGLSSWVHKKKYGEKNIGYHMLDKTFERAVEGLDYTTREVFEVYRNTVWFGSCAGMVKSAAIQFENRERLPIKKITSNEEVKNVYQLHAPKESENNQELTEDIINYYQLMQIRPEEKQLLRPITIDYGKAADELINLLKNQNKPIMADICNKKGKDRHMVLLLKVEGEESEYYNVQVWDPNVKDEFTTMKIYKKEIKNRIAVPKESIADVGNIIQISYYSRSNAQSGGVEYVALFYRYANTIQELDYHNYFENNEESVSQKGYGHPVVMANNNEDISVETSNAEMEYTEGEIKQLKNMYRMPISEEVADEKGNVEDMFGINTYSENGIYKIKISDKDGTGKAGILVDGMMLNVDTEKDANIIIDEKEKNATIQMDDVGKMSLLMTQNETNQEYPWYNTAVDIENSKEITLSMENDVIKISGDNLEQAAVAVEGEGGVKDIDISSEENQVVLRCDEEGNLDAGDAGYLKGDVNEDKSVDIQDLRIFLQYICDKNELNKKQLIAADINKDGNADVQDLRKLLRYTCGKESEL